jgi:acyl-CoA thioester hydrolase
MTNYQPYSMTERVHTPDLDAWNRLRTVSLLRYLEQLATAASTAAGFGAPWYAARQVGWVIRTIHLQRWDTAAYGDLLTLTTWVSSMARVRSWREYEIRRADGTPVAGGRVEWVFVDRLRQQPRSVDPDIIALFPLLPPTALVTPPPVLPPVDWPLHTVTRRAWRYEADAMGHINNTVYADWLEEAAGDAVRAWGTPLADPAAPGLVLAPQTLTITYLRSVQPGDTVTVTTTGTGAAPGGSPLAFAQTITRAGEPDVLIRAETVYHLRPAGEGTADIDQPSPPQSV